MTLTLAYIDQKCMVQVADRRISEQDAAGNYQPKHDQAIKVVMPRGSLLVSYSGVAEFAEGETGELIERQFSQADLDIQKAVSELAVAFTKLFERMRFRKHQLTATITGWAQTPEGTLVPVVGTITNREPASGARLPEFVGKADVLPYTGGWISTGGPLSAQMHRSLDRWIGGVLRRRLSPVAIVNTFLYAIRQEAAKNSLIGRSAFAVVFPRAAAEYALTHGGMIEVVENHSGQLLGHAVAQAFIPEDVQRAVLVRRELLDLGRATISFPDAGRR
jgi:hypothetical protein